jgi:hypothetical protein
VEELQLWCETSQGAGVSSLNGKNLPISGNKFPFTERLVICRAAAVLVLLRAKPSPTCIPRYSQAQRTALPGTPVFLAKLLAAEHATAN